MSDSTVLSLDNLPPEILHRIFCYLDIPDILRIRRVSRYLNQISHGRDVWSDAYRKAEFVRPPGPFPSQTAHDLENTLVSSFRVDRNLRHGCATIQTERPTRKLREIRYTGLRVNLVFGRYLLIASREEICCYDLNLSDSCASIIYRSTGGTLRSFRCASAVDLEGCPFACAVLSEETQTATQISIYSVNVGKHSEVTLDLLHRFEHSAFDIITVDLGPRVMIIQGQVGRDSDADKYCLVALDVHTRTQYLFPSVTPATWKITETSEFTVIKRIFLLTSISTSTHLLLSRSFYATAIRGWKTLIQAFALPHPNTHHHLMSTSIPLSLSHCGTIFGTSINSTALLHDSVLDPTTQDVLITTRVRVFEPTCPFLSSSKHAILRLSTVHTSHDPEIGTVTLQLLDRSFPETPCLHPSFNGTGRVFYTVFTGSSWTLKAFEYIQRTSGDGGEQEAKVVEYPSLLRFLTQHTVLDYDPYFGRICLRATTAEYNAIEIFDLAV